MHRREESIPSETMCQNNLAACKHEPVRRSNEIPMREAWTSKQLVVNKRRLGNCVKQSWIPILLLSSRLVRLSVQATVAIGDDRPIAGGPKKSGAFFLWEDRRETPGTSAGRRRVKHPAGIVFLDYGFHQQLVFWPSARWPGLFVLTALNECSDRRLRSAPQPHRWYSRLVTFR